MQFSPDDTKIISASFDKRTSKIINVADGALLANLAKHSGTVISAKFSPDGRTILTCSYDSTARIWDSRNGNIVDSIQFQDMAASGEFSPDGKTLFVQLLDSTVTIWNAKKRKIIKRIKNVQSKITIASFNPIGNYILAGTDKGQIGIYDLTTGDSLSSWTAHTQISSISFSNDGKKNYHRWI